MSQVLHATDSQDDIHTSWVVLLAPAFLAGGLFLTSSAYGRHMVRKANLFAQGVMFFVLSRDAKWPKQTDPDVIKDKQQATIRVVFVRHGESVWNEVLNRRIDLGFLFRLFSALLREAILFVTPDSVFIDSPLSHEGITQAKDLLRELEDVSKQATDTEDMAILKGLKGSSVIVASNLRRALQTAGVVFWGRLQRTKEKVVVASSLQEISRNIDCLPLAAANELPYLNNLHFELQTKEDLSKWFDPKGNTGNKTLGSNGLLRMRSFAEWAFQRQEKYIIVVGHSLWFRSFFRTFLPAQVKHAGKDRKIDNCGVVAFTLACGTHEGKTLYRIDPESITALHRGFQ